MQDLSEDDMSDGDEGQTYRMKEKQQGHKATVVDDQFFKLSEMSKFLDQEDQKETKRRKAEDTRLAGLIISKSINACYRSKIKIIRLVYMKCSRSFFFFFSENSCFEFCFCIFRPLSRDKQFW